MSDRNLHYTYDGNINYVFANLVFRYHDDISSLRGDYCVDRESRPMAVTTQSPVKVVAVDRGYSNAA